MKMFAATCLCLAIGFGTTLAARRGPVVVSAAEAAKVWGAGGNCVQPGISITLCMYNQTCNPMVTPPVAGSVTFNDNGSQVTSCYMSSGGNLYCPCGTSSYYLNYMGSRVVLHGVLTTPSNARRTLGEPCPGGRTMSSVTCVMIGATLLGQATAARDDLRAILPRRRGLPRR